MRVEIIHGDCLDVMRDMDTATVDAIVTDPPYHLTQASRGGSARVPGTGPFGRHRVGEKGFMGKTWDGGGVAFTVELWAEALRLAKSGTRLLAFGGTRTYHRMACAIEDAGWQIEDSLCWLYGSGFPKHKSKLKPAHEPIVMARKPASRATLLNIDECRVEGEVPSVFKRAPSTNMGVMNDDGWHPSQTDFPAHPSGRWPANVVLDEEAARALDEMSGDRPSCMQTERKRCDTPSTFTAGRDGYGYGDTGGASRFYYVAKSSRAERTCDGSVACTHPTVKPVALMRWLVRLVTPPNGLVLDPFTGSGTTGIAAVQEGRRFIGIEREAEYVEIARSRIAHHTPQQTTLGVA